MELHLVGAVDERLAVVRQLHGLRLAGFHLALLRVGAEHRTPVGVLAHRIDSPCQLVGSALEARPLEHLGELRPRLAVVGAVEAVVLYAAGVGRAYSQRTLHAGGELGHNPEALARSEELLLLKRQVLVVGPVGVAHRGQQRGGGYGARAVVYLKHGVLAILALEIQVGKVEAVGELGRVDIEILRHGVGQFGVVLADVCLERLAVAQRVGIVGHLVVGGNNGIGRSAARLRRHLAGEGRDASGRGVGSSGACRHHSRLRARGETVLQYALARVLHAEAHCGRSRLGGVDGHAERVGVELGGGAFVGCGLNHGRHGRRLAPSVVGDDGEVVGGHGLQSVEFVLHAVAAVIVFGVYRLAVERREVGVGGYGTLAVVHHMVVNRLLVGLGYGPLQRHVVVRGNHREVCHRAWHARLAALQGLVGVDYARAELADVLLVGVVQSVYRRGEQRAQCLVGEVLVAIFREDERGHTRHMGAGHRRALKVSVRTVGQGAQYLILLAGLRVAAGGGHVDPSAAG